MKKLLIVPILAVLGLSTAAIASDDAPPPTKVWICHFEDHTADSPWMGGGALLDGDYVLEYRGGPPSPTQAEYCEVRGGHLLNVPAVAAGPAGHKAQLLDRIDGYPAR